ncbi:MAG: hypothetical protein CUN57_03720, partial [Phototrophicales bacterium]
YILILMTTTTGWCRKLYPVLHARITFMMNVIWRSPLGMEICAKPTNGLSHNTTFTDAPPQQALLQYPILSIFVQGEGCRATLFHQL